MWRVGKAVALNDETASARTLTLEVPDWPGHIAGQHVDVRLTASDGYSAARSYSIASAPNSENRLEITVERFPNGEVSPYLTQELSVGDRLELRGPIGGWFVWHPEQLEPIQLIAGGSGIVPLMAMIRFACVERQQRARFDCCTQCVNLRRCFTVRNYAPWRIAVFVRITQAYTRAAPKDWPLPPGRINAELIANATWPSALSPTCYVCGPTSFVESASALLTVSGHGAQKIRTERFGPTGDRR